MAVEALEAPKDTDATVGFGKRFVDPIWTWEMELVFVNRFANMREKTFGFTAEQLLDLGI
jgi:hypothetical protein